MEYALGLAPKDPVPANRPYARIENGYLTLTYTRSKSATDVAPAIEQSSDLLSWQSGPGYVEQVSCVDQGVTQLITVRLVTPANAGPSAFLRLKVTK